MKVAIVVPNWNGAEFLAECLESLEKQTAKAELVVVDNGSTDKSVDMVKKKFPNVRLIKNFRNLGFAGGVNVGLKQALGVGCEYVALFNNDAVADPKWLENLVKKMENKLDAGIVTGKFMRDDKTHFDSTGDFYSTRGIPFPRGRNRKDEGQYEKPEKVFSASGGASLYRSTMLKEIGLFDERFFAYYEDVDVSFRARLYGWEVYYDPQAIAYHRVGATSSKLGSFAHFHSNKNFYFLYLKNMPMRLILKYFHSFIYQALRSFASSVINLRLASYIKAVAVVSISLPGIFFDRWRIQRSRKVSAHDIEQYLTIGRPPISPEL